MNMGTGPSEMNADEKGRLAPENTGKTSLIQITSVEQCTCCIYVFSKSLNVC